MTTPTHVIDQYGRSAAYDVKILRRKDAEYGSSWKKRGGAGAFMMLARKWDRLEKQVQEKHGGDIIAALQQDVREEGIQDDIGDLRRYLLLVYCELLARAQNHPDMMSLLDSASAACAAHGLQKAARGFGRSWWTEVKFLWTHLEEYVKHEGWDAFELDRTLHLLPLIGTLHAVEITAFPDQTI